MYEFLKGIIAAIDPAFVVLEVQGVGYKLYAPNPYHYEIGEQVTIYVEQVIRDNAMDLYGFSTSTEKQLFLKLTSVSGIGPKSAIAIMAAEDSDGLATAIENGEVSYLTKFPGVGKKTASQIVLDLKGKLGQYVKEPNPTVNNDNPALKDALMALVALGYSHKEVDRITEKLSMQNYHKAEDYIKSGLSLLLKKGR